MKKRRRNTSAASLLTKLAMTNIEMMVASSQVIHHRVGRMAAATIPLSARDKREFTQMVQEKAGAVQESGQALVRQAFGLMWTKPATTPPGLAMRMMRTAQTATKPFHRKAVANAKRLGAKKK